MIVVLRHLDVQNYWAVWQLNFAHVTISRQLPHVHAARLLGSCDEDCSEVL
jgi:hypothetical protein